MSSDKGAVDQDRRTAVIVGALFIVALVPSARTGVGEAVETAAAQAH